jgi:predicted O-methyltransferase YrrM
MYFNQKYLVFAVTSCLLFLGLSMIGWFILGEVVLVFSLTFLLAIVLVAQWAIYCKIETAFQEPNNNYRQLESLFSIFSVIKPNHVLPPMRKWAISPDFATVIISLIHEQKPKVIVEASSGVSTLLSAYCLKQIGEGAVFSLEHHEKYTKISSNNVRKHGLEDIVNVIHAPIKEYMIGDKKWQWYDTEKIADKEIDMLIIDGPERLLQKMSRYPAVPLLFKQLSKNAIIVLDDANRKEEEQIVKLWVQEFNSFEIERISNEKGAVILRRKISSAEEVADVMRVTARTAHKSLCSEYS